MLQLSLKLLRIRRSFNMMTPTRNTEPIIGQRLRLRHPELMIMRLLIIRSITVFTLIFHLLKLRQKSLRHRHMHKRVDAALDFFKAFGVLHVLREILHDESVLSGGIDADELADDSFSLDCVFVSAVDHLFDSEVELVVVVFIGWACKSLNQFQHLNYIEHGHTEINS